MPLVFAAKNKYFCSVTVSVRLNYYEQRMSDTQHTLLIALSNYTLLGIVQTIEYLLDINNKTEYG